MIPINFVDTKALLIFKCSIEHRNILRIWLALDTGSTNTIISREALEYIGFQAEEMSELTTFGDASQPHIVPEVLVPAFGVGDATVSNLEALCYSLPEEHGIDGVIGLNFLRRFKRFTVDFEQAQLILERRVEAD